MEYADDRKFRTWLGRPNPIDAKKLGVIGRAFAFILILFLLTMPFCDKRYSNRNTCYFGDPTIHKS